MLLAIKKYSAIIFSKATISQILKANTVLPGYYTRSRLSIRCTTPLLSLKYQNPPDSKVTVNCNILSLHT